MGVIISAPVSITSEHDTSYFNSGVDVLDHWLKHRALRNHNNGASKTFVVTDQKHRVAGYYCLSAGSVSNKDTPGRIRRNMPDPIPVILLGRLAVDKDCQNMGLGRGLLKDSVLRTVKVSRDAGVRALLVHAISETAKHFYKRHGFIQSPLESMTLMLSIKDIESFFI